MAVIDWDEFVLGGHRPAEQWFDVTDMLRARNPVLVVMRDIDIEVEAAPLLRLGAEDEKR